MHENVKLFSEKEIEFLSEQRIRERESKLQERRKEFEGERASLIERKDNLFKPPSEDDQPKSEV